MDLVHIPKLNPITQATEQAIKPAYLADQDFMVIGFAQDKYFTLKLEARGEESWRGVSWNAREFISRIPEHFWIRNKYGQDDFVKAGASFLTVLVIANGWPLNKIEFENEEAELEFKLRLISFHKSDTRLKMVADFKEKGIVPELPSHWRNHPNPELKLSDYQVIGVLFALGFPASALFADRGTGKTAMAIQLICEESRRQDKPIRALVVCPPQVLDNWMNETKRFATLKGKASICRGTKYNRIEKLVKGLIRNDKERFTLSIVGYDTLKQDGGTYAKIEWDLVIYDESHFFKSSDTKRWKDGVLAVRKSAKQVVVMTGSPIGNSPMDLWTQMEATTNGQSGFTSFNAFCKFHGDFVEIPQAKGVKKLVGMKHIKFLQENLSRFSYQITKEEAGLKLPAKQFEIHSIEMTKAQQKIYTELETQLAVEIENTLTGEITAIRAEHILTKLLRLSQITSGFIVRSAEFDEYSGEETVSRQESQINGIDKNPKIQAVLERFFDPDREDTSKIVVWCNWKEDCRAISEAFTKRGVLNGVYNGNTPANLRTKYVQEFNYNPEFRVFIANPQTAAEGLNLLGYDYDGNPPKLETNCDEIMIVSQNWSSILRQQLIDRAHRRGTRVPLRVVDIMVPGTIDEEIYARVAGKIRMASTTLDVKSILQKMRSHDY